MWEDGACFIIGGGTSVPRLFDVPEEVIQKVCARELPPSSYSPYTSAIHNKHIIGVNNAYQLGEWIDILFFGDNSWYIQHREALKHWAGLKVSCNSSLFSRASYEKDDVKCLDRDKEHPFGISSDPTKVSWNGNSGAAAINLAVHLGVKKIFLLGFDMVEDTKTGYTHWHGTHLLPDQRAKRLPPFARHLRGFPQIAKDAKEIGIEIFNLSPMS
ncbi:MAG: hypothetical protein J7M38_11465, partial [Armatimonadetes bacterium]|nr:hypothetical protein [Armatimonadota bacterium]